ncbi:MAG: hypothetical protein RLO05_07185 [Rhodospirillales bacterium]
MAREQPVPSNISKNKILSTFCIMILFMIFFNFPVAVFELYLVGFSILSIICAFWCLNYINNKDLGQLFYMSENYCTVMNNFSSIGIIFIAVMVFFQFGVIFFDKEICHYMSDFVLLMFESCDVISGSWDYRVKLIQDVYMFSIMFILCGFFIFIILSLLIINKNDKIILYSEGGAFQNIAICFISFSFLLILFSCFHNSYYSDEFSLSYYDNREVKFKLRIFFILSGSGIFCLGCIIFMLSSFVCFFLNIYGFKGESNE